LRQIDVSESVEADSVGRELADQRAVGLAQLELPGARALGGPEEAFYSRVDLADQEAGLDRMGIPSAATASPW
jgi:hypothetical protein